MLNIEGKWSHILPISLFVGMLIMLAQTGCQDRPPAPKDAPKVKKFQHDNYHCPPGFEIKAPSEIVTDWFCGKYNIDTFLDFYIHSAHDDRDSSGAFGIFDSTAMWKLQMIFTSVKMNDSNRALYNVEGAARLKKAVRHFTGFIHIDTVRKYDRNYWFAKDTCDFADNDDFYAFKARQFDEKNLELTATFEFRENKKEPGSGFFKGKMVCNLTLDSTHKVIDNMNFYEGAIGAGNYQYEGHFTNYAIGKTTYIKWSPQKIDELFGGCQGGAYQWRPCCNDNDMVAHGWKTDDNCQLIDDPKLWWLEKKVGNEKNTTKHNK